MNGSYILLGQFSGKFLTEQRISLGASDAFPHDESHAVQVYSGKMEHNTFYHSYVPDNYRTFESFRLLNVPNIEVMGSEKGAFQDRRTYTFSELIIIDPTVSNIHEINGKCYGEVYGRAYGKTEPNPQVGRIDPDPISNRPQRPGNPLPGGGVNNTSELGGCLSSTQGGCLNVYTGCLNNIKRILTLLFLILLLLALFKYCDALKEEDPCDKKRRLENEITKEQKVLDSLEKALNNNFPNVMERISTVYFYKNSSEFQPYSIGPKKDPTGSNLLQLEKAFRIFSTKSFEIVGYASSMEKKTNPSLGLARANLVKSYFVSRGISPFRLGVVDGGILRENYRVDKSLHENYATYEYNQDMRVVIQEKKK